MRFNLCFLPAALFGATLTIATVQAAGVMGRIGQILKYRWKFQGYVEQVPAISAGTIATGMFIVGTLLGIALGVIGYRRSSRLGLLWWQRAFALPLFSLVLFGVLWITLILSPLVVVHHR